MLYQSGTQRIEVIVKKESGASQEGVKEKPAEEVSTGNEESVNNVQVNQRNVSARFVRINTQHGLRVLSQGSRAALSFYVSGLGNKNGDQAYQEQVERQMEIFNDVSGFLGSTAMGALSGVQGGPWGIAIGALAGATSSAISIGEKYLTRERDFNYKVFKENNAIEYQRARASISLTTGRLR